MVVLFLMQVAGVVGSVQRAHALQAVSDHGATCETNDDCDAGHRCWGLFNKHCSPYHCSLLPLWMEQEVPGLWELKHNRYTGGFTTDNIPGSHAYDYSDCLGMRSDREHCFIRCNGPKFAGSEAALTCDENGELVGHPPVCGLAYGKTEVVQTGDGPIQGVVRPVGCTDNCVDSYFGVPYAAPPVKQLRFRPPQRHQGWRDVLELPAQPRDACISWIGTMGMVNGPKAADLEAKGQVPEDCLHLDIIVPQGVEGPLPVQFHIWAGGFVNGDTWNNGGYDGAGIARNNRVIFVAPSFRQGLLGHMALKALKDSDPESTTGNYGLQDQRAALEWIQRNIHLFGGDPARVHIHGVSSGGASVQWHRLSPRSHNLFSAATMHGAMPTSEWWWQPLEEADNTYSVLSFEAGCPTNDRSPQDVRHCLQNLNISQLFQATSRYTTVVSGVGQMARWLTNIYHAGSDRFSTSNQRALGRRIPLRTNPAFPFLGCGPCVDGSEVGLPGTPKELIASGKVSKATTVSVSMRDEGTLAFIVLTQAYPHSIVGFHNNNGLEKIVKWIFPEDYKVALEELYPPTSILPNAFQRGDRMCTDVVWACPNRWVGAHSSKYYVGEWVRAAPGLVAKTMGAFHGATLAQIFYYSSWRPFYELGGNWGDLILRGEKALALWLNCQFANMAHCGDPNGCPNSDEIPSCKQMKENGRVDAEPLRPYTGADDSKFVVNYTLIGDAHVQMQGFSAEHKKRCDFWDTKTYAWVDNYYNEGAGTLVGDCVGTSKLAGSDKWLICGVFAHSCDGQCCCDFGYQADGDDCVVCSQEEIDEQTIYELPSMLQDSDVQESEDFAESRLHSQASAGSYVGADTGVAYRRTPNKGKLSLEESSG
eukprot:CAMPEP_0204341622 /NCGR_PEP_ID=MMETSP0469-20131031/23495_1 /ASSEMBLY_ACC=CAM_ASM_000384 /TAXON_ID=2969 /ORGANISM="Oxyrrhis marina" /LENGTH=872 /DNA_ID=CAMNT_0051326379 /DNA_START=69 /DNA_END=2687 /DNA_ORIENTATION=+